MISVLVVTRKRIKCLRAFFDSIQETCNSIKNLEVLVRIDDDDIETVQFVENYRRDSELLIRTVIGKRGKGYADMDKMVDELCQISTGDILFLLNDDAQFITKNWDEKMLNSYNNIYSDNIFYIRTAHNQEENPDNPLFPAITRDWYDALGGFCSCLETDTGLYFLNKLVKREVFIKDIKVNHNHPDYSTGLRDDEADTTYMEGRIALDSELIQSDSVHVFSPEGYANIVDDAIKLCSRIKSLQDQKKTIRVPTNVALLYWKYLFKSKLYYHIYLPRIYYAIRFYNHYFWGSSVFCMADLKDSTSMAIKLRGAQDPLSQYLRERFSKKTQRLLHEFDGSSPPSKTLHRSLVGELNRVLKDDRLYDEQRFAHVSLMAGETRKVIEQNPTGKDRIRLNRLLLEEAYPHEIVKSYSFKWKRK